MAQNTEQTKVTQSAWEHALKKNLRWYPMW